MSKLFITLLNLYITSNHQLHAIFFFLKRQLLPTKSCISLYPPNIEYSSNFIYKLWNSPTYSKHSPLEILLDSVISRAYSLGILFKLFSIMELWTRKKNAMVITSAVFNTVFNSINYLVYIKHQEYTNEEDSVPALKELKAKR